VHGEDLLVDDGGDGEAVEAVGESLPQLDVVSPLACFVAFVSQSCAQRNGGWDRREGKGERTLIVESVNPVDRRALVVTTEDEEVLRVLDLVREEEADRLERLLASVDVVTEEEVVGFGRETTVLEEAEEVVVLAVDVTCAFERTSVRFEGEGEMKEDEPQILMGASSSRRIGWLMKISRAFVQRNLISYSCS
jgi:hypothetical protein